MWNIKFAIRSLKKSLGITFINILGFSLGLSVTFFIIQYLLNEYNYDSFHTDKERIYRVAVKSFNKDKFEAETYVYTSEAGTALKTDLPQVEQFVTITYPKSDIFYSENSPHKIENYLYASNDFFRLFSFSLKLGDPNKVLESPYSLVVTEALAQSIFGKQDPVGKQLTLDNELYTITGVAANPPKNSDIQFNMLVSFSTRYKQKNVYMGWNGGNQYIHFVKLVPGATLGSFVEKAASFMWKYVNKNAEQYGGRDELYLQPLTSIHLYHNQESAALRRSMLVFLLVATMLLIVVIINFINLFMANSGKALKTLSVVKIHGASRFKMLKYLLSEVAILIATSILIALFLVWLFHPYFEQLAGKPVPNIAQLGVVQALVIVSVILAITLVSALFPSILISSVQPLKIIKNEAVARKSKNKLKDGLVIFQFFVSVLLIVSVLVSEKQIRYIQKFDLGYNKENILILPLQTPELQQKAALLKQETLKLRSIKSISAVSQVPNDGIEKNGYVPEGKTSPEMISAIDVDEDFLSLLNIQVTNGENFSQGKTTDDTGYLINETLAKKMGWNDPIGRVINRNGDHQIVGVVKDFNFASLRSLIQPLIITNKPWNGKFNYLLVKTGDGDISRTIKEIEEKWESISPNSLFEYSFLDQQFEQTYKAELSLGKLLKSLSVLTIFIALLGLIGLSKIITDSRVKEIGLRKVNGATIGNILMLLNKNYIALITASFILATPIAYYAMNRWLENFAYKTTLSWWIFALAGLLALGIALLTVSYQSWKAATKNPVEALRYE